MNSGVMGSTGWLQEDTITAPNALVQVGALPQVVVIFQVQDIGMARTPLPGKASPPYISHLKVAGKPVNE